MELLSRPYISCPHGLILQDCLTLLCQRSLALVVLLQELLDTLWGGNRRRWMLKGLKIKCIQEKIKGLSCLSHTIPRFPPWASTMLMLWSHAPCCHVASDLDWRMGVELTLLDIGWSRGLQRPKSATGGFEG